MQDVHQCPIRYGFTARRCAVRLALSALAALLLVRCDATGIGPGAGPSNGDSTSVTLVGAGDIAHCGHDGAAITAALLDEIPGTVFTAGDNAYPSGTPADFTNCYEPTWGRHKARTRPAIGNHEYETGSAAAYFEYFGDAAGEPGNGYYSYELGRWHVVVLNSEIDIGPLSNQIAWLRDDLAASQTRCTLAYWHQPRFSSGQHGDEPDLQEAWHVLYNAGSEIVISGHDHDYERFAPQGPFGDRDPTFGIREFVVGTGGVGHRTVGTPRPNSQIRNADTFGVLVLNLNPAGYTWEFVSEPGESFTDHGTGDCHDAPND